MTTLTAKVLADFTTSLATSLAIGATTATLQSATDDDGVALPSGVYYFTLDGNNSSKEHIRCSLSGTSLTSIYSISRQGVATSGTVRAHRLGATVTLTDFAHILVINNLVNGTTALDSAHPLKYDGVADMTGDTNKLATVKYVDDTAIAGSPDASTTVKGIGKVSVAPASAANPIFVGDNDTRVPTQSENDALVGTSGTPSSSNKYVTDADTTGSGSIVRSSLLSAPFSTFFGDGSDGDVTISADTTLTSDKYYNNLTINSGKILNTGGYRIFVKATLTNNGIIRNNGGAAVNDVGGTAGASGSIYGGAAGGNSVSSGGVWSGAGGGGAGVVWISAYAVAVQGTIEAKGGNGSNSSGTAYTSSAGTAGGNIAKTLIQSGTGGKGGDAGNNGGAGGTISSSTMSIHNLSIMNLFIDTLLLVPLRGGAGGGSGASIVGGFGGGGGGMGGVIYFRYSTLTTSGTTSVSGGTGGTGSMNNGANGSSGLVISTQVV